MRRKFAMIAAFVVAISGAIATKASPNTTFKTVACTNDITCVGSGAFCGYLSTNCPTIVIQKKQP